ncbi:MAG: glycosyltransferase family 2 protein [Chloroflexales bacterium]|nr:glycosyltransferase family 2 protein [Chloroflexales bacterium]
MNAPYRGTIVRESLSPLSPISRPPISAIVPTWNALRYLPACLMALRAQLGAADEIILVDNASRDNAAAWARRFAADVRLLELPRNLGFAGGVNAGITAACNDLLLLCNDDALVEPACVAGLWEALHNHPQAGAAAGVLTFSTRPGVVASVGISVRRNGVATDLGMGAPVSALPIAPHEIFGASGGLMLLRRAMIDDIGPFAAEFFNYLEDVDLAWRARLRGWSCRLAPTARARHVYSASSVQGSPFKQRLLGRNRLRAIIRCMPAPLLRQCLPAILSYDVLALAYAALRRQPAIATGRMEALRELPALREQRRSIQARRTATIGDLARWLEPALSPVATLRQQEQLARKRRHGGILQRRSGQGLARLNIGTFDLR